MTRNGHDVVAFGDAAVLIVLPGGGDELAARVHRLSTGIGHRLAGRAGFGAPVPAAASLLVPVDPVDPGAEAAVAVLGEIVGELAGELDRDVPGASDPPRASLVELPTRYGGDEGPDLDEVAALHGLSAADVVEIHSSVLYSVRFLGFAPGFAYLGPLHGALVTPRLARPRERVPGGSVGIAGDQTAVYPFHSPGGWRLIGRTDARVWDVAADPPARLLPGTRVRFVPVRR